MERATAGDPEALRALGDRLRCIPRFLGSLSRRRIARRSDPDHDDLVQDTYVSVLRRLREFRGDAALETWACGFARVEVLRHRQRRARCPRLEAVDLDALSAPAPATVTDDAGLGRLLARMSGEAGEIARARHVEGLSFAAIAARRSATPAAVRSTYYRGLSRVRHRTREA